MIDLESRWDKYDLEHWFDFTSEDLEANRKGILSERQKQSLLGTYSLDIPVLLYSTGVVLLLAFIAVPADVRLWIIILAIPAFAGVYLLGRWWTGLRIQQAKKFIATARVRSVTGTPYQQSIIGHLGSPELGRGDIYLGIGSVFFRVSRKSLRLFSPTKRYRVFYTRSDHRIWSVEEVVS